MMEKVLKRIDWLLVFFIVPIILAGLFTMKSFTPQDGAINFFEKQIIWIVLSFIVFFAFSFGVFSFQPIDVMKLVLILILSKYFSRRHVEIRDIKHIFISGFYALIPF